MLALADVLSDTVFLPGSGCRCCPGFCRCWLKVPLLHHHFFSPSVFSSHCHCLNCLFCRFEPTGYSLGIFPHLLSLRCIVHYFSSLYFILMHTLLPISVLGLIFVRWTPVLACHIICGSLYLPHLHSANPKLTSFPLDLFQTTNQCKPACSAVSPDSVTCPLWVDDLLFHPS